jgi:beta-lactamase superfamily II metal-dependent hydrolase
MPASLDEGRLYIFVFGPGYGESVAVRVPPDEWLVIDSCRIEKQAAALHVLRRYGGKLALLLLTHRHMDHYRGFVDLIAWGKWNRIGCNDWRVADAVPVDVADPEDQLGAGLAQVLAEIQNQWQTRPASRLLTRRGASCHFGEGILNILHPDEAFALANRNGKPNNLSAAAVLEWKGMSILFGADVENPHWQGIAGHRANLGTHIILKVPHHASREAQHKCFLQGTPGRTWIVTPYNALNSGLPRFEDGQGMAILLRHEAAVHLTGLPVRHSRQEDEPCETTRQDLLNGVHPRPIPFDLPGGITGVEEPTEPDRLLCYVGVSLDATGGSEVFHGRGSLRIREGQ